MISVKQSPKKNHYYLGDIEGLYSAPKNKTLKPTRHYNALTSIKVISVEKAEKIKIIESMKHHGLNAVISAAIKLNHIRRINSVLLPICAIELATDLFNMSIDELTELKQYLETGFTQYD